MTDYSCVRNNIVAIGDVNTWNDKYYPGNTRTDANDTTRSCERRRQRARLHVVDQGRRRVRVQPHRGELRRRQGRDARGEQLQPGQHARAGGWRTRPSAQAVRPTTWPARRTGRTRTTSAAPTGPRRDKRRLGMRVTTYVLDVNEYGQQTAQSVHKQNQFFLAAKYGGFKDASGTGNPYKAADTERHQRRTGRARPSRADAKNYFLSSSARGVLDALDKIFANIAKEANSIAGGAISTQRLTSVGGFIFQAQFDPADWSGDLIPYPVTLVGDDDIQIGDASTAPWTAATRLDAKDAGEPQDLRRQVGRGLGDGDRVQVGQPRHGRAGIPAPAAGCAGRLAAGRRVRRPGAARLRARRPLAGSAERHAAQARQGAGRHRQLGRRLLRRAEPAHQRSPTTSRASPRPTRRASRRSSSAPTTACCTPSTRTPATSCSPTSRAGSCRA